MMGTKQKIFGIGLSRTGTTSLTRALEILGFQASHWEDHHLINQAIINNEFQFDLLEKMDALTDLPIPSIYQELDQAYPNSKFILTTRNFETWLPSVKQHYLINVGPENPSFNTALCYGSWYFDEEKFSRKFHEHEQEVKAYFQDRPDDLLVFNIVEGEGWEQLCPFLGKEIPDVPFPIKNQMDYSLTQAPERHPEKRLKGKKGTSVPPSDQQLEKLKQDLFLQNKRLDALQAELDAVYRSWTWRLMRLVLVPLRWLEDRIRQ